MPKPLQATIGRSDKPIIPQSRQSDPPSTNGRATLFKNVGEYNRWRKLPELARCPNIGQQIESDIAAMTMIGENTGAFVSVATVRVFWRSHWPSLHVVPLLQERTPC